MTAMMVKIGGAQGAGTQGAGTQSGGTDSSSASASKGEYERVWSPGEFYRHKKEFNSIGDEIDKHDKERLTLDRFMRLFEADCSKNTGWNMLNNYENALLQKILYVNDLITNLQQKTNIAKAVRTQNNKLERLEKANKMGSAPLKSVGSGPQKEAGGGSPKKKKKKTGTPKKGKKGKRKKMD